MTTALLAISDADLRAACRLVLEGEASYAVTEAHNGLTTFTRLFASPRPLVVVLDSYLAPRDAALQLLRLAAAGGPTGRQAYVVCLPAARRPSARAG
jgi:CheY-like chemotaxis protein